MKVLILGIGNSLLTDEGVGVHVVRALRPDDLGEQAGEVELLDGGTLSFTLAGPIGEAEALVVVDAAELREPPGTLRVFEGEEMDRFLLGNRRATVHEVGLTDLRAVALLGGYWPARRALVAIQPQVIGWGEFPSPSVAAAVPRACDQIRALVGGWRHGAA